MWIKCVQLFRCKQKSQKHRNVNVAYIILCVWLHVHVLLHQRTHSRRLLNICLPHNFNDSSEWKKTVYFFEVRNFIFHTWQHKIMMNWMRCTHTILENMPRHWIVHLFSQKFPRHVTLEKHMRSLFLTDRPSFSNVLLNFDSIWIDFQKENPNKNNISVINELNRESKKMKTSQHFHYFV